MCDYCCAEAYFANPIDGDLYEHHHFDIFYSYGNDNFFYRIDGNDDNEKIFVEYCPVCGEPLVRPVEKADEPVSELEKKGLSAACKFLENKEYIVKETNSKWCPSFPIVAFDAFDDSLHFIAFTIKKDMESGFDETEVDRNVAEKEAMMYLAAHSSDDIVTRVVFDKIDLVVVNGSRAMLRLHTNILGITENEA